MAEQDLEKGSFAAVMPWMGLKPRAPAHSGEGSRGGQVIGHTSSGKPIYAAGHHAHVEYNQEDKHEAADLHEKRAAKIRQQIGQFKDRQGMPVQVFGEGATDHHSPQVRELVIQHSREMNAAASYRSGARAMNRPGQLMQSRDAENTMSGGLDEQVEAYLSKAESEGNSPFGKRSEEDPPEEGMEKPGESMKPSTPGQPGEAAKPGTPPMAGKPPAPGAPPMGGRPPAPGAAPAPGAPPKPGEQAAAPGGESAAGKLPPPSIHEDQANLEAALSKVSHLGEKGFRSLHPGTQQELIADGYLDPQGNLTAAGHKELINYFAKHAANPNLGPQAQQKASMRHQAHSEAASHEAEGHPAVHATWQQKQISMKSGGMTPMGGQPPAPGQLPGGAPTPQAGPGGAPRPPMGAPGMAPPRPPMGQGAPQMGGQASRPMPPQGAIPGQPGPQGMAPRPPMAGPGGAPMGAPGARPPMPPAAGHGLPMPGQGNSQQQPPAPGMPGDAQAQQRMPAQVTQGGGAPPPAHGAPPAHPMAPKQEAIPGKPAKPAKGMPPDFQKSMTGLDDLGDYLEKAAGGERMGHKYIRREGVPGRYMYVYAHPQGHEYNLTSKEHFARQKRIQAKQGFGQQSLPLSGQAPAAPAAAPAAAPEWDPHDTSDLRDVAGAPAHAQPPKSYAKPGKFIEATGEPGSKRFKYTGPTHGDASEEANHAEYHTNAVAWKDMHGEKAPYHEAMAQAHTHMTEGHGHAASGDKAKAAHHFKQAAKSFGEAVKHAKNVPHDPKYHEMHADAQRRHAETKASDQVQAHPDELQHGTHGPIKDLMHHKGYMSAHKAAVSAGQKVALLEHNGEKDTPGWRAAKAKQRSHESNAAYVASSQTGAKETAHHAIRGITGAVNQYKEGLKTQPSAAGKAASDSHVKDAYAAQERARQTDDPEMRAHHLNTASMHYHQAGAAAHGVGDKSTAKRHFDNRDMIGKQAKAALDQAGARAPFDTAKAELASHQNEVMKQLPEQGAPGYDPQKSMNAYARLSKRHSAVQKAARAAGDFAAANQHKRFADIARHKSKEHEYAHRYNKGMAKSEGLDNLGDYLRKAEAIPGGLASGKSPSDFDPKALAQGMKVEREHSDDPRIQREVAMDHLAEDPLYYRKLARMEGEHRTEKCMSKSDGLSELGSYLAKSDGMPDPSGWDDMDKPAEQTLGGSANGGDLTETENPGGNGTSGPGEGQDKQGQVTGAPEGQLDTFGDDRLPEQQMTPGTTALEDALPEGYKSMTPANQRGMVAREHAQRVADLSKANDVRVGGKVHPYSMEGMHGSSDAEAAELCKSDFYNGGQPTLAPPGAIIRQSVLCKSQGCGCRYPAMLTSCPNCGDGMVKSRLLPKSAYMGGDGGEAVRLEKAVFDPIIKPAPVEADVHIPGPSPVVIRRSGR